MSEKRQAVLATATRLFARYGYQAVGIDRIIEESCVAKMTLYKHFRSKSELIVQVLKTREIEIARELVAFVNAQTDDFARIQATFDWYDQWVREKDFKGCMFIKAVSELAGSDVAVRKAAADQRRHLLGFIEQLLAPLVGPGEAPSFATSALILIDGAIVNAHICGNTEAVKQAWDVFCRLLPERKPARRTKHSE